MKINYELVEKIGATHYSKCYIGYDYYKLINGSLWFWNFLKEEWCENALFGSIAKPIPPKPQPESDYDRGMRKAMQAIAKSCGKVFGADIGYDDLPVLVESLINTPKQKPPVRVEYERAKYSKVSDAIAAHESGVKFKRELPGGDFTDYLSWFELCECYANNYKIVVEIEKPVDWREILCESQCGVTPREVEGASIVEIDEYFNREQAIELARDILRATGEL